MTVGLVVANEDELDPLGWPHTQSGLSSDPPQMDPFGEVSGSDYYIDHGDNLLESTSCAVDDDGVGGFHSDEMVSKDQCIQAYVLQLSGDSTSDEEEEGQES